MKRPSLFFILFFYLVLASCSSVEVGVYSDNQPKLVAEEFFNGRLTAHGIVKDMGGKVIRHFNAEINAYWQEGIGTLEEDFVFDDGEKQRRVWKLTPNGETVDGNRRYIGTAGDVIGESDATVAGNSLFMEYVLRIPYNDSTLDITIDDRMYLVSPTVVINESTMKKFGVTVGQILLVIEKR